MDEQRVNEFWEQVATFRDTLPAEQRSWVNALVVAAYAAQPEVTGHTALGAVPPLPQPPPPQLGFNFQGGMGPTAPTTIFDPNQPAT